ncbi:MAG: DUF192 domain-containing protein [Chloroflexi bacterium]|nr:DUF192 domain-containing protein [Chloroflexota bacterium]
MIARLIGSFLLVAAAAVLLVPNLKTGNAQDTGVDCSANPYAEVQIPGLPHLRLELARTPAEREVGLMYRAKMDFDAGMLFVYTADSNEGYWMRNTFLPLSIAFIDNDGTIITIRDMQPRTDDIHQSARPYRYALETNQGWFDAAGVREGDKIVLCFV